MLEIYFRSYQPTYQKGVHRTERIVPSLDATQLPLTDGTYIFMAMIVELSDYQTSDLPQQRTTDSAIVKQCCLAALTNRAPRCQPSSLTSSWAISCNGSFLVLSDRVSPQSSPIFAWCALCAWSQLVWQAWWPLQIIDRLLFHFCQSR